MKKVIIFDMDGVLIDSETIYHRFHPHFFDEHLGIRLTQAEIDGFTGVASREIFARYKALYHLPYSPQHYVDQEYDLLIEHFEGLPELPIIEGIPELLETLQGFGFKLGMSSSNQRRMVELCLRRTGLSAFFEHILSGEDVPHAKPDPTIFLQQANHFKVSPTDCVVIEDSTNGVAAAKAAGMFCIGYVNPHSGKQDLSPADWQITSWTSETVDQVISLGHPSRMAA